MKTIGVVMALFILGAMAGCRGKEGKYVGTYIEGDTPGGLPGVRASSATLELKRDGTYTYTWELQILGTRENSVTTGEWRVVKSEGEDFIEFTPTLLLLLKKTQKSGYCFEVPGSNTLLVREK
jgi:hypothetical protein